MKKLLLPLLALLLALTPVLCPAASASTGKIVYYSNVFSSDGTSNYQIFIINGDGTNNTRISHPGEDDLTPALSPDGTKIAFVSSLGSGIFLMNPDGTGAAVIPNTFGFRGRPAWSADGTKLAALKSGAYDTLFVFKPDGSEMHQVTAPGYPVPYEAAWSPDGTKLVFWGYDRQFYSTQLYIVNADGASAPVRLSKNDNAAYRQPSWSPDGTKIACQISGVIYLLDPTTGAETRVTPLSVDVSNGDESPTFSPDGTQLAFQASEDSGLGVMNLDGSNRHSFGTPRANDPKWSRASLPPPPPPPPHGGLGDPTFQVNESTNASASVADTVLRFRAVESNRAADVTVRVQSSTDGTNWTDLNDGNRGQMTYSIKQDAYVLNSTSYPTVNGVSFRVLISGAGYGKKASSAVGPFNLASSKQHLAAPGFSLPIRNGTIADLLFRATDMNAPSGTALRVQSSTSPGDESSWTDLADGTRGAMLPRDVAGKFYLTENNLPPMQGVYFRVIASNSTYVDGISRAWGSYTIVKDVPPTVTIQVTSGATTGTGTAADPYLVPGGHFHLVVTATPDGSRSASKITKLEARINSALIDSSTNARLDVEYSRSELGDYLIEGIAMDDLGATARAGSGAIHVRVTESSAAVAKAESTAGGTTVAAATAAGKVYHAVKAGVWSDPATWNDAGGKNGVPGKDDLAVINQFEVDLGPNQFDITVGAVSINDGGALGGPGNLTVLRTMTLGGGQVAFFDYLGIFIESGAVCELINRANIYFIPGSGGSVANFYNKGTVNVHGTGGLVGMNFHNQGTLHWDNPLDLPANPGLSLAADTRLLSGPTFTNTGLLTGFNIDGLISQDGGGLVATGAGNLVATGAGNLVAQGAGNLISQDGGGIVSHDSGGIVSHDSGGIVSHDSGGLISQDGGGLTGNGVVAGSRAGGSSRKAEQSTMAADSLPNGYTQAGGNTNLDAMSIIGPVNLDGGVLSGAGVIVGDLANNGGYVTPGQAATGVVGVTGNYTQGAAGTLVLKNGGADPSQFDQLQIAGVANLGGKLEVKLVNGYTPAVADTANPLAYSSATGSVASVSSNSQVTQNGDGLLIAINPAIPSPAAGQPLNIATRLQLQGGNNGLIEGFIITGPSGSTKKVLIRGIGPSLAQYNIPGLLTDPLLELHDGAGGIIVANDNWQSGDTSQIPTAFQPSDPRESVIVATLTVGANGSSAYSAVLKGANGETGVGVAEVYDFETGSSAKLANIATRGFVQTGDNVMIGGFIIGGSEPAKVLVRVTGPTLAKFGISGQLDDPTLELHDANGGVISNDNWRETQESEIIATTIPPADNREPAILATLVPGGYSAVVRGKSDTTGIAVVEAYNLP